MVEQRPADILLITPLELEMDAILNQFGYIENLSDGDIEAYLLDNTMNLSIVAVRQDDYGKDEAVKTIRRSQVRFSFRVAICVGIAGSLSRDVSLGDVCYSKKIVDLTERQKIFGTENSTQLRYSPNHYPAPLGLQRRVDMLRTDRSQANIYSQWQTLCIEKSISLGIQQKANAQPPKSIAGSIACHSAVISSTQEKEEINKTERKMLAIENESGGIFSYCTDNGIAPFSIRGISDYADEEKGNLESQTEDTVRELAAHNAAAFFRYQLDNIHFTNWIEKENSVIFNQETKEKISTVDYLLKTADDLEIDISDRLQELSQEFRLQNKGYKIPVPRVEPILDDEEIVSEDEDFHPIEIVDIIKKCQKIFVIIPDTYPEASLPWIIAYHLLQEEIDGRRVLPFVIDGGQVRPPRRGFKSITGRDDLNELHNLDQAQLVFIIEDPHLSSETRSIFLSSEMERFSNAKFILISKNRSEITINSKFVSDHGIKFFSLSRISFSSMVYFLQKNFGLQPAQAEVIAHRLTTTFDEFDLLAHPSYVAGIPREILASLLRANKRAELIELAVTGHLMMLVASDTARTRLSRTTRLEFLEIVAERIHIDKTDLAYTDLVKLAEEFSSLYDYQIDPKSFVDSYINIGILSANEGLVYFVFPFIEYFALASVLVKKEEKAVKYFDMRNESTFDLSTFDLYSELGPSKKVVSGVIECLSKHRNGGNAEGRYPTLVDSGNNLPTMIKDYRKLERIQDGIKSVYLLRGLVRPVGLAGVRERVRWPGRGRDCAACRCR